MWVDLLYCNVRRSRILTISYIVKQSTNFTVFVVYVTRFVKRDLIDASDFVTFMSHDFVTD